MEVSIQQLAGWAHAVLGGIVMRGLENRDLTQEMLEIDPSQHKEVQIK